MVKDVMTFNMPTGAAIVFVAAQDNYVCLWAIVDPEMPTESRTFKIIGTGHEFDDYACDYYGSVIMELFVWHVVEQHDKES